MANPNENEKRIREILARLEWMSENLWGCDWCCGGGDYEKEELQDELSDLGFYDDEFMTDESRRAWDLSISMEEIEAAGRYDYS